MTSPQEGIYYEKGIRPGESLGIIFLRADKTANASEVGQIVARIWETCKGLKKGIFEEFKNKLDYQKLFDDLTVLIGYGQNVFDLKGALRTKPRTLSDGLHFSEPRKGGGSLFPGSQLTYHEDISENHAAFDDIVIQFISKSQFITNQMLAEVWRELWKSAKEPQYGNKLSITKFYTGFRRADNRNWMGFHDGLSNIKDAERKDIIFVDRSKVQGEDLWLIDGTFMGFVRIFIDLEGWWGNDRNEQEILVGRDKITGCPLIGVDKITKKNIVIKGCPVPGTREVTEDGNQIFRNHPSYGFQVLPPNVSDDSLKFSHIGAMRVIEKETPLAMHNNRIFRQGFEFLEQLESYPTLRAGLNFISFQDDPKKLFNVMTGWQKKQIAKTFNDWNNLETDRSNVLGLNKYFKVGSAGIFLVPPINKNEEFPGASIFFPSNNMERGPPFWKQ